jgi:Txe/YoeB family toxin of toxin-antitoxin system
MNYEIKFSKRGVKDYEIIKKSPLKNNAYKLLKILQTNPYKPPVEKLKDNLQGKFSRRLNRQHRLVYEIREDEKVVNILSMWTHYE